MTKLTFVLPTRNRPQLAVAAVRALVAQGAGDALGIVVSDNSSSDAAARELREACEALGAIYLRPPKELPMGEHWDWALEQAMTLTDGTHFGIHYDRKIAKPDGVARLLASADRNPDLLIAYPCDFTYRTESGFGGWQFPVTGREYVIGTSQVLRRAASGSVSPMGQAWPHLSNCIVPRPGLERVRARFGSLCNALAPDAAFGFRFCAIEDRYLFLDEACRVMYAFSLSNGQAYYRRDMNGTFGDFMKLWSDRPWLDAAPIPGLTLGTNCVFHEYALVQRVAGEERFPPIDADGYLRELALGLGYIADPDERAAMRAVLEEHGWREEPPPPWLPRLLRRAAGKLRRMLGRSAPATPPEPLFESEAEAVQYLLERPGARAAHNPLLDIMNPSPVSRAE